MPFIPDVMGRKVASRYHPYSPTHRCTYSITLIFLNAGLRRRLLCLGSPEELGGELQNQLITDMLAVTAHPPESGLASTFPLQRRYF